MDNILNEYLQNNIDDLIQTIDEVSYNDNSNNNLNLQKNKYDDQNLQDINNINELIQFIDEIDKNLENNNNKKRKICNINQCINKKNKSTYNHKPNIISNKLPKRCLIYGCFQELFNDYNDVICKKHSLLMMNKVNKK